jgi:hypothetical protein
MVSRSGFSNSWFFDQTNYPKSIGVQLKGNQDLETLGQATGKSDGAWLLIREDDASGVALSRYLFA